MLRRPPLPDVAAGAFALAFAVACARFTWQPSLASFADDSASYLVMAQVFSPWAPASAAVAEAFARDAFYPPLFPLLLGLAGAGHDIASAHVATALLVAGCLPAVYFLGIRWLGDRWAALAAMATTALLPSVWIQAKGILSEPLFCLALTLTLSMSESGRRRPLPLALAMAALALSRTVGLIVIAAYALHALSRPGMPWRERARWAWPALAAFGAYALWVLLRPSGVSDDYMRIVMERLHAVFAAPNPAAAAGASFLRQANALGEAWIGALMLFWAQGRFVPILLASALGAVSVAGLIARLLQGRADAWMVTAYVATFLLWPFYDQMTRFLFPILPVLVLYAFWVVAAVLRAARKRGGTAAALVALAFATLSVPALAFIQQRAGSGGPYAQITDWYRTPDLDRARFRARIHLDLLADMDAIRDLTRPPDRLMWVAPSYIALLAGRHGVPAPDAELSPAEYRGAVQAARPDYVFLSLYHPRDTIRDLAWRTGTAALVGYGAVVHVNARPDGTVSSILLRLKNDSLVAGGAGHD